MEIFLIRHTSPIFSKGMIYGHTDVLLADSFDQEKLAVLHQLPQVIDAVFSSPLSRCTQLASVIAKKYDLEYQTADEIMELNFGDWEGQTWDQVAGPDCEAWMNDFVNVATPNGESMVMMEKRIADFFKYLLMQRFKNAAVVTHGGVIRIVLAHFQSRALKDAFGIKVEMAEVIKLSVSSW